VKLETAQAIVDFVVREAPGPVSVFVADAHGELVAAATMDGAFTSESFAFARFWVLRFAQNARGLSPHAPGKVGEGCQPCAAAKLRVAAAHQFACA